jgi:hypothetical protein
VWIGEREDLLDEAAEPEELLVVMVNRHFRSPPESEGVLREAHLYNLASIHRIPVGVQERVISCSQCGQMGDWHGDSKPADPDR